MFDHLVVKRIVLEGLVESGHDYADLRRRMGHPMGAHDLTVIHRVDCQLQDAESDAEKVQVLREDVDRLYELRRRMRWLDRSLMSRIFSFYTAASYVLLIPLVFKNACIVILAPLVAWTIPFFLYSAFVKDPLSEHDCFRRVFLASGSAGSSTSHCRSASHFAARRVKKLSRTPNRFRHWSCDPTDSPISAA